jgi:hypothetical protein
MRPEYNGDLLVRRARDALQQLGYAEQPRDEAYGFAWDEDLTEHARTMDKPAPQWDAVFTQRPSALDFWYRQSGQPLTALTFHTDLLIPAPRIPHPHRALRTALSEQLQRSRQVGVGDSDDRSRLLCARRCRGVRVTDIDPSLRELLDGSRQSARSVRELEKEDVLFREQIAGPRQRADGDVAVHDQQADASIFPSGFRRVDRQEVHASVCEIAAHPRQRADLVVERQIELRG